MTQPEAARPTGKVRDLALHLLDRQILDTEGTAVGKVDNLELTVPIDGSAPYITALLTGPQALAPRLGGLLGHWLLFWSHAIGRDSGPEPGRISMDLVTDLGVTITVAKTREELDVHRNEDRARDYLISRIPGACDAR